MSDPKEKRATKAAAKKKNQAVDLSENATTAANETSQEKTLSDTKAPENDGLVRHKKPTVAERRVLREKEREVQEQVKQTIKGKYDVNQKDSDDSSDEEVLVRTGDVPQHWYELYDHSGYSVDGKPVEKLIEPDELAKFIER